MRIPAISKINWTFVRDGFIVISALSGTAVVLAMSALNVYANLVNSGSFVEMEWIAASLSVLPAIGTFSIKFLANLIGEQHRKKYAIIVNSLTIAMLVLWAVGFAFQFHNNAGGEIDLSLSSEGSGSNYAVLYTMSQILCEIMLAASLFLAAEDIYTKYASDIHVPNPAYVRAENEYQKQLALHRQLLAERAEKSGQLKQIQARETTYFQENMTAFLSLSGQL